MENTALNKRHFLSTVLLPLILLTTASDGIAQSNTITASDPIEFQHKDWQLVCDNTRTCRAVGYQKEDSVHNPIALMLKRQAGKNQRVRASVILSDGSYGEVQKSQSCIKDMDGITLSINGTNHGKVSKPSTADYMTDRAWELTTRQTHALINTLSKSSSIVFTDYRAGECQTYTLSDKGSTAVLLKMDEVQGRVGTNGAMVRHKPHSKNHAQSSVLPALPVPTIKAIAIDDKQPVSTHDRRLFTQLKKQMTQLVKPTLKDEDITYCPDITDNNTRNDFDGNLNWQFTRLSANKILAEHQCWTGAYNIGIGYWLLNDTPPYQIKLITDSGSDHTNGTIDSTHKGRGIGDCWSNTQWQWANTDKGADFVKTQAYSTGMCRGIAAGGGFILPTVVSKVTW